MLGFNDQYNVLHGIYITFSNNSNKRLLVSKHKGPTREKVKNLYPVKRYEIWTKENLVLLGLHIMLEHKPSSFHGMLKYLIDDENDKKVKSFKDIILNYKIYIKQDVDMILETIGEKPLFEDMFKMYTDKKIKFYTLWWYIKYTNMDINALCEMRVKGNVIKRLKQISLFLTYKEENLEQIKKLLISKLDLSLDL